MSYSYRVILCYAFVSAYKGLTSFLLLKPFLWMALESAELWHGGSQYIVGNREWDTCPGLTALMRCKKAVSMDGWIVIKENMSTDREGEDG